MDADLEAMRSIDRFTKCVTYLLEPLLQERAIVQMPCKHGWTFEAGAAARQKQFDELGLDDPGDDTIDRHGYCDCTPFNRRNELWLIGEMCVIRSLTINQLRDLSSILLLVTRDAFTYNHARRAMHDLFNKKYETFLEQVARKRSEGASFNDIAIGVVPQWQYRMMPNI
ncbi:MAG: hypothetical protein ACKVP4_13740 [Hyphomicrobium sp.]